jgi:gliding motility-associated-like protein
MLMKEKIIQILFSRLRKIIFSVVLFFTPYVSFTQCTAGISNFPYNENFETSNGNWVTGGTFSDWTWGTPSKAVINAAGSGLKCWITGGLNIPGYNDGENAWLKSPCFNFTNLKNPYLKFKVFWETEGKYDGANLQYSTDNGATWQLLGSKNETNNCLTEKWYNDGFILSLGSQDAWSGNIQSSRPPCFVSGGSAGWVTAKHNVPNLAGNPNVMFRFMFASNTGCNNFDGFAVDDFTIEEAPASTASFIYNCSSNLRVNFVNTSSLCPTSFLWNFDDPSSGVNNTSTLPNPTHAYTSGGNYNISLTVSGPGNISSTFTLHKLEIIENIIASIITPIRCYDDSTGSLTVNFIGDSSGISYKWDSDPVQTTKTAVHLGAGDYNVTILNTEGCPASANISLGEPPPLLYNLTTVKPGCTASNGSIAIAMSGGSQPYSYRWLPDVSTTSSAKNIPSGTYTVTVTDNNLCYKIISIDLPDAGDLAASISTTKDVSCFGGKDGMATTAATGGNKPYAYLWSSTGANTALNNNLAAGNYTATVTDAKGCKALATAVIHQPPALASVMKIQNTFCGSDNGNASIEVYGGIGPYQYTWSHGNYTNASVSNLAPGQYTVIINDNNGCIKNDTAIIGSSSAVNLQLSQKNVSCAGELTGAAEAIVIGGSPPYNFQWSSVTQIFNSNPITNVGAGAYNLKLQDAVGCSVTASLIITQPEALKVTITTKPSYCDFSNGSASAAVSGGVFPYTFLWTPLNNTTSTLTNVYAGNYQLTVTDKNNCSTSILTTILNDKPKRIFLGNDTTLCPGSNIILSPGIYNSYKWQDNSASANYTVTNPGTYTVEVTDDLACILRDTIKIIGDCGFIFFPTAFTPNGDMKNNFFGPVGILSTVKDYTLLVYNRLGQLVFKSTDPFKKWDGKMQGNTMLPGTYVWLARYSNKGKTNIFQKGTVTLIY